MITGADIRGMLAAPLKAALLGLRNRLAVRRLKRVGHSCHDCDRPAACADPENRFMGGGPCANWRR